MTARVSPVIVPRKKRKRRSSVLPSILSLSHRSTVPSLDPKKFDELMKAGFAYGFEESATCFSDLSSKASIILNAEKCYIFLLDDKEHKLFTFLEDENGNQIKIIKPLDRGITGSVLLEPSVGINTQNVTSLQQWSVDLDEFSKFQTSSYLAWPLWDFCTGNCIGVLEFRNKKVVDSPFSQADSQLARIIAFHLSTAIVQDRQKSILAGRNEAISIAYEKNYGTNETIRIDSDLFQSIFMEVKPGQSNSLLPIHRKQTNNIAPSLTWNLNGGELHERGWDYDVCLQSEEELIMHTVDVFNERGLFSRFSISMTTFVNFVNEIKKGYSKDSPYHSHYHAFDVMHVCYLLITKCKADELLDGFNILSLLVGALGHDLGHDGFNNSFHSATQSKLAIMYNDNSILENYSAAYLFRILRKENCNIFSRLNNEDMTKMRSRLIDLILDTDAKNHFMLMNRFKHGMEMKQLSHGLLSSMLLHVSDVSNPTRPGLIARRWAFSIQEEFFRQGDKEKELNLPRSPFMDREFENLPRMQGTFIDALVMPVFKLLGEFLPSVNDQCINNLQMNREFWKTMQSKGIITTDTIISYLKSYYDDKAIDNINHEQTKSDHAKIEQPIIEVPIPGIPANAPTVFNHNSIRNVSLISLVDKDIHSIDPELGEVSRQFKNSLKNTYQSLTKTNVFCFQKTRQNLARFLETGSFQAIMLIATIYALFAYDLNLTIGKKNSDYIVDIVTFVVLILFLMEMILSIICVPKYVYFFLWLDLAASISLLLEIDFLVRLGDIDGTVEGLSLAKASRAAKAGAKAGRLAKLFRVLRLVKAVKLMKWTMRFIRKRTGSKGSDMDIDETVDLKMSVVGQKMTESITKKVIIAVMMMLAVFTITDSNFTPDARQFQLDALAEHSNNSIFRDSFFATHDNIIELQGLGEEYVNKSIIEKLRKVEILTFFATSNSSITASFDLSNETAIGALYSLGTTFIVTVLLATLGMMFSRDAYKIMIRPIEKMKSTVQKLSENPLLHLEKMKQRGISESNETDILEQAINKMATLLQVGFGCAGAEIIAKSLSDVGELDFMVPGLRVNAIFGFCDIRDFTLATEYLQQDVMLFVNKVAQITHKHVIESGGAPNKNIGDAFLLVWKLHTSNDGSRSYLQRSVFDSALFCFQKIISDVQNTNNLAEFMQEEIASNLDCMSTLRDFKVRMGFGLHSGWAIEGSIGSKVKIDASYLSPHVNLASRLEAATKQYRIPLLMSNSFVSGLTGSIQSTCRRVDNVVFKGSKEAMIIFYQDIEKFEDLKDVTDNYANLMYVTSWKNKEEVAHLGIDVNAILKMLMSENNLLIREVYDRAFNAYLDREWNKSKVILHLWLEKFPGDIIAQTLVEYLMKFNFECPLDWPGHHILDEK